MKKTTPVLFALLAYACLATGEDAHAQLATAATVTGAYDGDTIYVTAAVWPNMLWAGSVRVLGVDTPEIQGRCVQESTLALEARDYVRDLLTDESVLLTDVKNDKYGGRVLAHVFLQAEDNQQNLAALLIERGLGRDYDGGTRQSWCGDEQELPEQAAPVDADVNLDDPLALYDDNNNGRITCAEARKHGIAPVKSDHPAYRYMNDRDRDGVVCE